MQQFIPLRIVCPSFSSQHNLSSADLVLEINIASAVYLFIYFDLQNIIILPQSIVICLLI